MSTRTLAIDIQHDRIIAVLLNHGLKGHQILESTFIPIPGRLENTDMDFPALKEAMSRLADKITHPYDRCIASIPATCFFFRTLELPFKNRKKIEQIIPFELENYLPLQTGAFAFDFCMLNKTNKTVMGANLVSIASIREERLEQYQTVFKESSVPVDGITVGSGYSMSLAYAAAAESLDASVFIYAEPFFASIYLARYGQIVFSRSFVLDSDAPQSSLEKNLTYTCLSFNERFNNQVAIHEIALSGTAVFLDQLARVIQERMQINVHLYHAHQTLGADVEERAMENALAVAVCEAKGIDGFNFSRQMSNAARLYQEYKSSLLSAAALVVVLLLVWSVQPVMNIHLMKKRSSQLDRQIVQVFQSSFPDIKTIVDPVQQMQVQVAALQKKQGMEFLNDAPLNIDIFHHISSVLPDSMDIIMTRFVRMENNLLVSGTADQFNTIDKMKSLFEDIAIFKEVDINSASMDKTDNRVIFSLKIAL